ncbi:PIR protein [Plasmodium vivax]|uniref:VIR protein n=1 Tax=Plasmodium vivax TaxID=5855 RepID=A0A565A5F3_PLAVI|nr:PIR protein [Plasmodium vivax]
MSNDNNYLLENIAKEHPFIENLNFYKIHEEFNKPCDNIHGKDACYSGNTEQWSQKPDVKELLKDIHSNLYKIYSTLNKVRSRYFDNAIPNDVKICCVSLKYWLYDKIFIKGLKENEIKELFEGWENHIYPYAEYYRLQPCNFHNLNKDEIKRIKNIYALNTILQSTMENLENCNEKECKYKDYFEQGLVEFINSANKCSSDSKLEGYCAEFSDFLETCYNNNENKGIKIFNNYYTARADNSMRYLLSVQKTNSDPLYIYVKDVKWLNWDKFSHLLNTQKSTTIAATSIAGSAVGLSSIFYYLYKFTPFGSTLRKGKGKNIVDIDERANDSMLYTPDTEQIPFKNREYKVAYHTFSDT